MAKSKRLTTREEWKELLDSVDTILFDCDGVLWVGSADLVPGAKEAITFLRSLGKQISFVSNNSSKSRKQYLQKFTQLGIDAREDEVFSTSYVTSYYMKHIAKYDGKIYLMGVGLQQDLEAMGYSCIGPGPDPVVDTQEAMLKTPLDPDIGAVVVGYDPHISFLKLLKAASYLERPGCLFVATNEDERLPCNGPVVYPGTGCIVSAVKTAACREPTVMGKPHRPMFDCLSESKKLDPARTLMVGDRLNTDIFFGARFNMKTLLVLTGIAKEGEVANAPNDQVPDYIAPTIADILLAKQS